jgi:hypothetical protein
MDQLDMTATNTTPGTETTFAALDGWAATPHDVDPSEEVAVNAAPPGKGTDGSV